MWVKHKTSGSQPTLRFDLLASCLFHAICGGSEDCRFFVLRRRGWCCLPIVCLYFGSVAVYRTRSGAIRGSVAAREMRERTNKVQTVGKLVPKVQTVPWSNPRYAFVTADYKPARMPAPKAEPARLTAAWKTVWHNASDVLQTIVPPGQCLPCTTRPKQSSTDAYARDRAPRWVHNKHRPIGIPMYKRSDDADMVQASGANRAASGWKSRWRPPFFETKRYGSVSAKMCHFIRNGVNDDTILLKKHIVWYCRCFCLYGTLFAQRIATSYRKKRKPTRNVI